MDLLDSFLLLILVLLTGCLLGLWLFVPWLRGRKSAGAPKAWVLVWVVGWALQAIGWLVYFLTYRNMDFNPAPTQFSQDLMGLSCLLWIVAFSLSRKVKPFGIVVLSGLLAVSAAIPLFLQRKHVTPPSDQELIANFQQHQAVFSQLQRMAQVDTRLQSISATWTNPADLRAAGVSPARIDQYRRLFTAAGVNCCGWIAGQQGITLEAWGIGGALSSDTDKGYTYVTKPPADLLPDLDHCQPNERDGIEAYRHVQGNWYLFYDHVPG